MNIKCDVIVDAWLGQIVVTGCEVGILFYSLKQCQPSSCIFSPIKTYLKTCHEILSLLEIVVVSKVLVVFITVSNCRYKLSGNLYLEIFIGKENDEYALYKIRGEIFHGSAVI